MGKYTQTISEIASLVADDLAIKFTGVCKATLISTIITIFGTPSTLTGQKIGEIVDDKKGEYIKI